MSEVNVVKITNQNKDFFKVFLFDITSNSQSELIGVVCDGCACGISEISIDRKLNCATIDHFYIAEAYRRQHIGSALMEFIISTLDGVVNKINVSYCDDEEHFHEFLASFGFIRSYRASAYSTPYMVPEIVNKTSSLTLKQIDLYRLSSQLHRTIVKAQDTLYKYGYHSSILTDSGCDKSHSFVIAEGGNIDGIIVNRLYQNSLYVDYIIGRNPKALFQLIRLTCNALNCDNITPDKIFFLAVNSKALPLIKHLFPDSEVEKQLEVYDAVFEY